MQEGTDRRIQLLYTFSLVNNAKQLVDNPFADKPDDYCSDQLLND